MFGFLSDSKIFHSLKECRRSLLLPERTAIFNLCSALMAIEQWGFFSVAHLLWHEASVTWHLDLLPSLWQWICHLDPCDHQTTYQVEHINDNMLPILYHQILQKINHIKSNLILNLEICASSSTEVKSSMFNLTALWTHLLHKSSSHV